MSNIVLHEQGDATVISQHGQDLSEYKVGITKLKAVLNWRTAVDLDIHAFYRMKMNSEDGHVNFGNKGSKVKKPYIHLDKDAGVGNIGGDNQEIITIGALQGVECILIATNIFRVLGFLAGDEKFSKYDGEVQIITSNGDKVTVPLTSNETGRWCVIALIDNTDPYSPVVTNINKVVESEPKIDDFLDNDILDAIFED